MVGTASRVRRWLLIEQHGPWGRDALQESYLDAGIAARVAANAKEHGVRVLLTRRVGADRSAPRTVHLVRSDRDRRWIEQLVRSEEHTSELQSLMRISYAVFCLKKKKKDLNK